MADRSRQQAAATVEDAQQQFPLDMLAVADWIRRLKHPLRLRQLLEALLRFGWAHRHERGRDNSLFDSVEPPETFVGEWWVKASKNELAAAIGMHKTTIKRALADLPADGMPPLLTIVRAESTQGKRHLYVIDLGIIRGEEVDPVQGGVDPVHGPGPEPGPEPGSIPLPPILGSLGDGSLGFLDFDSQNLKPNPPQPKGDEPRISWGRILTDADLTDVAALGELFPKAIAAGYAKLSEQDWLQFVALARYAARQTKVTSSAALFTGLLTGTSKRKWDNGPWRSIPTNRDTDWARQELQRLSQPAAVDADVQAASAQVGQAVEYSTETEDEKKQRMAAEFREFQRTLQERKEQG